MHEQQFLPRHLLLPHLLPGIGMEVHRRDSLNLLGASLASIRHYFRVEFGNKHLHFYCSRKADLDDAGPIMDHFGQYSLKNHDHQDQPGGRLPSVTPLIAQICLQHIEF